MAVTATPVFPQTIKNTCMQILAADAQTYKTICTAGTNGSKIDAIFATSTDTSDRDVTLNITISSTNYQIAQIKIPLTSGYTNSVPAVDILRSSMVPAFAYDAFGNKCLYLASGSTLTVNAPVTLTTAKAITFFVQSSDF